MAEQATKVPRRRRRDRPTVDGVDVGPAPVEVHPSIVSLRGAHRAAHPDTGTILEAASHLLMANEWPINCPRFMSGLQAVGMDCVSRLQYIKLDHHLLTALVERWSPQTNSFHFPVGEMTVTLEDVGMILGLEVDGPPLIGRIVIGEGKRWLTWPDCCDDLLGHHPVENVEYHDPVDHRKTSTFRMGQAHAKTCMPLRWLRWSFYRDSYIDLSEVDFTRHIRAYILFMLGCFLLPDTSGSEVHLQYLPLLEDLELFATHSIGGAVLAHLYRELNEATKPRRVNMAGCLHLLQIWSWEHLHVGRPMLHVPYPLEIDGLSIGYRWNEHHIRHMPASTVKVYRDELDGLLQSQVIWEPYRNEIKARVAAVCLRGAMIWRARVPLISWKRVEWYLPDRVLRQFGSLPRTDVPPMEHSYKRVDGRGKADVDWIDYHQGYIALWENRRAYVVNDNDGMEDHEAALRKYMHWYRSWASLYLLSAPTDPPDTYYPRAPGERALREHFLASEELFQPFYGRDEDSPIQHTINKFEELCSNLRRKMHISDTMFQDVGEEEHPHSTSPTAPPAAETDVHLGGSDIQETPSTLADQLTLTYPSSYISEPPGIQSQYQQFPHFDLHFDGSSGQLVHAPTFYGAPVMQFHSAFNASASEPQQPIVEGGEDVVQHRRHDRSRRAPDQYTPGTDAIPRRRKGRRH